MSPWLAAAYCVLALGLGWSLAGGRPWRWRVPFIVAAPALAIALWLGRPDPTGWPSHASFPANSALVSAVVQEPDPSVASRGRIYLWLEVGADAPRAFSIPYSRSLRRQVEQALSRVAERRSVQVTRRRGSGHGSGNAGTLRFLAAPSPALPPKH